MKAVLTAAVFLSIFLLLYAAGPQVTAFLAILGLMAFVVVCMWEEPD